MLAQYAPDDGRVARRRPEPRSDHGVPPGATAPSRRHQRHRRRFRRLASENGRLVIGAGVRHQAFHRPVVPAPLGNLLAAVMRHIAHYPDPHPRHVLRQHRPRRPLVGMVPRRGDARRRDGGAQRRRYPRHRRRGLFPRHHDDGARPRRAARRSAAAAVLRRDRWGFYEFNRRAGDFAMGMALVAFEMTNGVIARRASASAAPRAHPRRIAAAEALLDGQPPGARRVHAAAAEAAAAAIDPLTDAQTDADLSPRTRRHRDPPRAGAGAILAPPEGLVDRTSAGESSALD